jgi:hypothetical protein
MEIVNIQRTMVVFLVLLGLILFTILILQRTVYYIYDSRKRKKEELEKRKRNSESR